MDDIERLSSLFQGAEDAYGVYIPPNVKANGEKEDGESFTERKPVTRKLWEHHVSGMRGLGIIPIKPDNTCVWGCIDVDDYPPDIDEILKVIKEKKLPLNLCCSKSGGIHLFLFVSSPVKPIAVQDALTSMRRHLFGKDSIREIFPKQSHLSEGQVGNWLNMPFFGETRLGIGPNKEELSLAQFLDTVVKADPKFLSSYGYNIKDFPDGPPCIQAICSSPVTQGNRNIMAMAMAIYYHKRSPDTSEEELLASNYNGEHIAPPLQDKEIKGIIKRVEKNNYTYSCDSDPLKSHCERTECLKRKYGIQGGKNAGLIVDKVLQYKGDEDEDEEDLWKIWMNHHETPVVVTSSELLKQGDFTVKYFQVFKCVPPRMSTREWGECATDIAQKAEMVPRLKLGLKEKIIVALVRYIEANKTENRNEVQIGKAYVDNNGCVSFRVSFFGVFASNRKISVKTNRLSSILKELGGLDTVLNYTKNDGTPSTVRVIRLSMSVLKEEETEIIVKSKENVL